MELEHAKRTLLQATLTPIEPPNKKEAPAVPKAYQPAAERTARLRAFQPSQAEIDLALQNTIDPNQKAILEALAIPCDPALITAIHKYDNPPNAVINGVFNTLVQQRKTIVNQAIISVQRWIKEAEQKRLETQTALLLAEIDNQTQQDKEQATKLLELTDTSNAIDPNMQIPGPPQPLPPSEEDTPDETPIALEGIRKKLQETIKIRFQGSCSWGSRLECLLASGHCRDAILKNALDTLHVHQPKELDKALAAWQAWEVDIDKIPPIFGNAFAITEPIGYLHLERLSFVPAGVVHGELVHSLPLAPGEKIAITHKEWAITEEEFHKFMGESQESASEFGVSEKTDMSTSASMERQHSNALNVAVSISGGYGPVNGSINTSYSAQQSETESRQTALNRSNTITKNASSRVRREHKISFRITTKTQVEDQSTKIIRNPDQFNCVRYDFFKINRRWLVKLHRYGVRLTYDLTIPEPGSDLLDNYLEIQALEQQISAGFDFKLAIQDINRSNWQVLASTYGAALEAPPPLITSVQATKISGPWSAEESLMAHFDEIHITPPDGYVFSFDTTHQWKTNYKNDDKKPKVKFKRFHGDPGITSDIAYAIFGDNVSGILSSARVWFVLREDMERAWQQKAHLALRDAAKAAYLEKRQALKERKEELVSRLQSVSGLTLRKLEREELSKNAIRWLMGQSFHFFPKAITSYYDAEGTVKDEKTRNAMLAHEKLVSFLHQAVEWENINSFLYPYFWTPRESWKQRLRLRDDDPIHEAFLRAGAARVVLPIRPGWEKAFLAVMETGSANGLDGTDHPYLTIAQEIQNYAKTNYPGIIPANPDEIDAEKATRQSEGILIGAWHEYTPTNALDIKIGETGPTEGEFPQPKFNPKETWGRLINLADAGTEVLSALAKKLSGG